MMNAQEATSLNINCARWRVGILSKAYELAKHNTKEYLISTRNNDDENLDKKQREITQDGL